MLLESDVSENKYKGLICDRMQKLLEKSLDANTVQSVGEVGVFPKKYNFGFRIIQIYSIFDLHVFDIHPCLSCSLVRWCIFSPTSIKPI